VYQEYLLGGKGSQCTGLTSLPPSCADSLENWEPQPPGNLRASPGLQFLCLLFTRLNEAVLHTIHTEAANIQASYFIINSKLMGCMESNWMTQTEQQMEKNSF